MLKHMYIDESGDLGLSKGSSTVLVISALLIEDTEALDKIIKNMRRNKFRKELRNASEIKANNSSPELRKHMIYKLNSLPDVASFHITFPKNLLKSEYLMKHKDKLYNFIAGKLALSINLYDCDLEVRIDKSKGKQFMRDDFNQYFEPLLRRDSKIGKLKIYHSHSHSFSGIQFADLLAWCVYQKEERNNYEYINLFKFKKEYYPFSFK